MGAGASRDSGVVLSKAELERVKRRFDRQADKSGRMSLSDLQRLPELSGNFFVARIFEDADRDRDGYLTAADFTEAVERLGGMQSDEQRLAFAFRLFDADEDGLLSRRDLLGVLQHSSRSGTDRGQLEKTVASLLKEYDADGDGHLNLQEFTELAVASSA